MYSSQSSSLSQQSSSQQSTEISLAAFNKLQESVQDLLNGQDVLLKVCSKQKAEVKKLKDELEATKAELQTSVEENKRFHDLVFPFFDKYTYEEAQINKVRPKTPYLK